ncbi:MAG: tetratricopeptide repeat protein [Deltaproteobacteria bacterium]|nr:tetratricopeptide repeat protein [Deltaproteobacteria bacterium]
MLLHTLVLIGTLTAGASSMDEVRISLERGHDGHARELLTERLASDARDIESLLALALLEMESQDYRAAIGYFTQLLELDPYDDDSRLELAEAYWRIKDKDQAQRQVTELLTRHPEWPKALELQKAVESGAALPAPPTLWSPLVRGDLSIGFDSNPRLDNTLDNTTPGRLSSGGTSAVSAISLSAGVQHLGRSRPFSIVAHLRTQQSVGQFDKFKAIMPTTVGLTGIGGIFLGPVRSELHLQYQELFTDLFSNHYQRKIRATASAQYQLSPSNRLQISAGSDVRQITDQATDVTARLAIRDSLTMGRFTLSIDARVRYNLADYDSAEVDPATLEVGFIEASSVLYIEYRFQAPFTVFSLADFAIRDIPNVLDESTFFVQGGITWNLPICDLHSEYAYTRNRSNIEQRDYNRHQFTLGVRFWYD